MLVEPPPAGTTATTVAWTAPSRRCPPPGRAAVGLGSVQNRRRHRSMVAVVSAPAYVLDNTIENPSVLPRTPRLNSANGQINANDREATQAIWALWSGGAATFRSRAPRSSR